MGKHRYQNAWKVRKESNKKKDKEDEEDTNANASKKGNCSDKRMAYVPKAAKPKVPTPSKYASRRAPDTPTEQKPSPKYNGKSKPASQDSKNSSKPGKGSSSGQKVGKKKEAKESSENKALLKQVLSERRLNNKAIELTDDIIEAIGNVEKMRPYFEPDTKTGQSLVDPNARRTNDGCTALQIAIKTKAPAAITFLLEMGADCSLIDYAGDNAVMVAIKEGASSVMNKLWPYKKDLDINHANCEGITALHLAVDRKWEGCVNFLLYNGANPDCQSIKGVTPLMKAVIDDMKIVERLLKAGADVLIVDKNYDTCISKAFFKKNQKMVDFLLDYINGDDRPHYVETILDIVPYTDEDVTTIQRKVIPLLEECTKHRTYRNSFYSTEVVGTTVAIMKNNKDRPDLLFKASHLILCIFFRFNQDELDKNFVTQFIQNQGPDLVFNFTRKATVDMKICDKQVVLTFLPMMGLCETPEGRTWMKANLITLYEYISSLKVESLQFYMTPYTQYSWCMENNRFLLINRTWRLFLNVIKNFETERRKQNNIPLVRKVDKTKIKQEWMRENEKPKIILARSIQNPSIEAIYSNAKEQIYDDKNELDNVKESKEKSAFESVFGEPLYDDSGACNKTSSAAKDVRLIAQMFGGCGEGPIGETSKETEQITQEKNTAISEHVQYDHTYAEDKVEDTSSISDDLETSSISINSDSSSIGEKCSNDSILMEQDVSNNSWTTVPSKKQPLKTKPDRKESPRKQYASPKTSPSKRKPQPRKQTESPVSAELKSPTKQGSTKMGTARWADVAKIQVNPNTSHGLEETNFPSLNAPKQKTKNSPAKFTFFFEGGNDSMTDTRSPAVQTNSDINIGDMVEKELKYNLEFLSELQFATAESIDTDEMKNDSTKIEINTSQTDTDTKDDTASGDVQKKPGEYNTAAVIETDSAKHDYCGNIEKPGVQQAECEHSVEDLAVTDNQLRTFKSFIHLAENCRVSDQFISLPSLSENSPNQDDTCNALDALFKTKAVIPQQFYSEGEQDKNANDTGVRGQTNTSGLANMSAADPAIIDVGQNVAAAELFKHVMTKDIQQAEVDKGRHVEEFEQITWQTLSRLWKQLPNKDAENPNPTEGYSKQTQCSSDCMNSKNTPSFPGFHDKDFRESRQLQAQQIEQLKHFYGLHKDDIMNSASILQDRFIVLAQLAGLTKEQIAEYIEGRVDVTKCCYQTSDYHQSNQCPLPFKTNQNMSEENRHGSRPKYNINVVNSSQQINKTTTQTMNGQQGMEQRQTPTATCYENQQGITKSQPSTETSFQLTQSLTQTPQISSERARDRAAKRQLFQQPPVPNYGPAMHQMTNQNTANSTQCSTSAPFVASRVGSTYNGGLNQIQMVQQTQAAMVRSVQEKISQIYSSMIQAKARSVRWKSELAAFRQLPSDRLALLGRIVIPKLVSDRVCISIHSTGPTILGYLTDGVEVAVKILDARVRIVSTTEIDKMLTIDVSNNFLVKYKDFYYYENYFYLAMELQEYTLTEYVHQLKPDDRTRKERLVFQLLRGLHRLHQQYLMIHGELRPDNIMIDVDGNLKVCGYGISRNINRNEPVSDYCLADQCWLAPEQLVHKQTVSFKSDIFSAGHLVYFILKNATSPFGKQMQQIVQNVGVSRIAFDPTLSEEAKDLLTSMLSVNKTERPCVSDALSHPLFWADEKRLRLISIVGSDIVWELKQCWPECKRGSMLELIGNWPCNPDLSNWTSRVDQQLLRDMSNFRNYKNTLVELVLFVHNYCNHVDKLSDLSRTIVNEPCTYFLSKFPGLFMCVYKAVKTSGKKEKTCYKPFFYVK